MIAVWMTAGSADALRAEPIKSAVQVVPIGTMPEGPVFVLLSETEKTLCVYQMNSARHGDGQLVLLAARSWEYDMQLKQYNTASPLPSDVKAMVLAAMAATETKAIRTVPMSATTGDPCDAQP